MKTSKRGQKGPPKSFSSLREAKAALTYLADSLANHSFAWPAAAIRSYLAGGSPSLDEAFGLLPATAKEPKAKPGRAAANGAGARAPKAPKTKAVAAAKSKRSRRA